MELGGFAVMHRILSFAINLREGPGNLTGSVANGSCASYSRHPSAGWTAPSVTEGVGDACSTTPTHDSGTFLTGERCWLGSDRSTVTTRRRRPLLVSVLAHGPNRPSTAYARGSKGPPGCGSGLVGSWKPTRTSSTTIGRLYSVSFAALPHLDAKSSSVWTGRFASMTIKIRPPAPSSKLCRTSCAEDCCRSVRYRANARSRVAGILVP